MQRFVVVGGGIAGHRAACELRKQAPAASIQLISDEPGLPYDRPPLSKDILIGRKEAEDIALSGTGSYRENGILYVPETRCIGINAQSRFVVTASGEQFPYDGLLLATGSRPRKLPTEIVGQARINYLRTLQDSLRLRKDLAAGQHVVVIGGGFIGLEVAAAATSRGCRVTVLEARDRVLARGLPGIVSQWVHRLHAGQGVSFKLSTTIETIQADRAGVILAGPDWEMHADVVVAGVGIEPNVQLATAAGLDVDDGLVVDQFCRTSDPHIFGAGEVTFHPSLGAHRRIESWKNSADQGVAAARAMTGSPVAFDAIPWLWSDQFDSNIQAIGLPELAAQHEVLGDPASHAWTLVSLDESGTVLGGIAVNRGRDASMLKRAARNKDDITRIRARAPA
ncbi:FAD-dependent oxidoreductase [Bradyrhizobium sp. 41S5]|uniref:NAD(P)/FAD-dependent oxidoreductase n=1 Tax=Bradyrhizobium sp. 41S5 TaxID=1404443 RepID=UPI00156B0564|nr:FAD-dependent oxidoreductase [Bradyrhizobium sp. 41S5]UFX44137.1 FAD-dependent oxidoreductase [Bradyrhizobium sp. 41S5]